MSTQEIVEEILEHVGVKGMKWGVRNTRPTSSAKPSRKVRKADKKFEQSINLNTWLKIHNTAASATNDKHIDRINNKPEYKKSADRGDFNDYTKPITQKYHKEHQAAFLSEVRKAADSLGTNASGTRKYQITNDADGNWAVSTTEIKHEDSSFTVKVITNDRGEIIKLEVPDEMAQSAIENILTHYGKKGMKWGVRKDRSQSGRQNVIVTDKRKKIKTSGGKGLPAHPEAIPARVIGQKAKKSGVKSLSNQELQEYARRIQLEQNVSRLAYSEKGRGARFVDSFLGRQGSQLANTAAKQGATRGGKAALNAATRNSRRVAKVASVLA